MRKFLSFIFGMVLLSLLPQRAWCQEAYAVLDGSTFTFYYDDLKSTREGQIFGTDNVQSNLLGLCPQWMEVNEDDESWRNMLFYVTTVVFDPSFADARPTSTSLWFEGCSYLENIEGLEYLNTSEVTSMNEMFYACHNLKEIDLSHFNTSKVETVNEMFLGCLSLTNLDLSSFDCSNLNVAGSMLIRTCVSLKSLTIAEGMYFNDGDCMFVGTAESPCVINYPEGYDFGVDTSGDYFEWCSGYFKLGEAYTPTSVTPAEKEAYAVYNNGTFTFYYDDLKSTREGQVYGTDESDYDAYGYPKWTGFDGSGFHTLTGVTNLVIDPSFADARPTNTAYWFMSLGMETIDGLQYLNTSEVTGMECMFLGCVNLKEVDLSHFVTTNVGMLVGMFMQCHSLTSLDFSSFDSSNMGSQNSLGLFQYCYSLQSVTLVEGMDFPNESDCEWVGTPENPCLIIAPENFDFGVDTSGDYFQWKSGYFKLGNATPTPHEDFTGQITVERKYKVGREDNYYHYPSMTLVFDNNRSIGVGYFDAEYWNNDYQPIHGVYIMSHNYACTGLDGDPSNRMKDWYIGPVIQDEWVTEKLVVNADGRVQYYMNGEFMGEEVFDGLNLNKATSFWINFSTFGWWTGYYHYMDDFVLTTPTVTIQDDFNDGVIDLSVWKAPVNPDGTREEDGILKMEMIRTDEEFDFKLLPIKLENGNTTPLVTLSNGDNEEPLSEYDGMTVDVELEEYTCQPEKWYSLCVPFDISAEQLKEAFGDDVDIQEMTGCAWNASEQTLDMNFNKVTEVLAGRPYLLRVSGAVEAPQFDGVTINSDDPLTINFGNCTMTGVLNATPLPLGDKSYLFIINNKFYYPATTNPLPAMRCYFHLLGDAAQANSVALNMENDADGIVSVISDSAADSRVYYSVQGVSTTRPTHGIYINNGKKVVIK